MTDTERQPMPIVALGPEVLLGLQAIRTDDDGVRGSSPSGPWTAGLGALGVLLDDVLGYAIIERRPEGRWSVSAEITLELLEPLPTDGRMLHAQARLQHVDGVGGLSHGEVRDDEGRLVAVGRQRGRFVPMDVDAVTAAAQGSPPEVPARDERDLAALLGMPDHGADLGFTVAPVLENPMGNLHGGISLSVADIAATRALADGGPVLTTSSIHTVYARAVPAGSEVEVTTRVQHRGRGLGVVEVIGSVGGRAATISRVVAGPSV